MSTSRFTAYAVPDLVDAIILIGPEEEEFKIRRSILCEHSRYFSSAYNSQMSEAQANLFKFIDIDSKTFSAFGHWLDTSQILVEGSCALPTSKLILAHGIQSKFEDSDAESEASEDSEDSAASEASEFSEASSLEYESESSEEYDEESDTVPDLGPAVNSHDLPDLNNTSAERSAICYILSDDVNPSELDVYQLQVLLRLCENVEVQPELAEFREGWELLLEEKLRGVQSLDGSEGSESEDVFAQLIGLYILADRFDVVALRFETINRLQHEVNLRQTVGCHDPLPSFGDVLNAFDNLPETSPLRKWLIHTFAYNWNPAKDSEERIEARKQLPHEFLMEVMLLNTSRLNCGGQIDADLFRFDLCFYHEHQGWDEVIACRKERGKIPEGGVELVDDESDIEQ